MAELITDDEYKDEFRGIGQLSVNIRPRNIREGEPSGRHAGKCGALRAIAANTDKPRGLSPRLALPILPLGGVGLFYQPLYFEEANLERFGYSPRGLRLVHPLLSAGNFFLTIPLLPYKVASQPPRQETYALASTGRAARCRTASTVHSFDSPAYWPKPRSSGGLILLIP